MTTASTLSGRRRAALGVTLFVAAAAALFVILQAPHALSADRSSGGSGPAGSISTAQKRGESATDGRITAADGQVDAGSPLGLYDGAPAVAGLDGGLLEALRDAADAAAADGVRLRVNSGWRSAELQERMLQDAVTKYGSLEEAERWVAPADSSEHVLGDAADIGPWQAASWLGRNGQQFGLCQIYANEPWHFELRPDAVTSGCPQMYRDPTERER